MKNVFRKYGLILFLFLLGAGMKIHAQEILQDLSVLELDQEQNHMEKSHSAYVDSDFAFIETNLTLKYSYATIDVPSGKPYLFHLEGWHYDKKLFEDSFLLPPKPLFLFYQVFQI